MQQRQEVLEAWKRYSATASPSPQLEKARAFFQLVQDRTDLCWDDLVTQFRSRYSDALDTVSNVLMATNNPLIMYNFTRFANPSDPKEANALKSFIRQSDVDRDQLSLAALAVHPVLQPEILNKAQLPAAVTAALNPKNEAPA